MYQHDKSWACRGREGGKFFKPSPDHIIMWVQSNFECKPRKGGVELCINNPFDGDTGYNFNIGVREGLCHDWRGDGWANGHTPTFLRFVQIYRGCTFQQAAQEVCGEKLSLNALSLKMRLERAEEAQEKVEKEQSEIKLPDGSRPIIGSNRPLMAGMLIKWLKSRGVDESYIKSHNIHHRGDDVIWPYYEYDTLVYWQSRNRLNKIYRFPSESVGVTKGMFLYGFDMVEPGDYCIIAEAIFGAHTIGAQCMASGGAVLTDAQVRKIRALNPVRGVILSPDNDKAGLKSIPSNYELIRPYFRVFYSIPPRVRYMNGDNEEKFCKDWNELITDAKMDRCEVRKLFETRIKPVTQADLIKFMSIAA